MIHRSRFFSIINFTIFVFLVMLKLGTIPYSQSLLIDLIYGAFFILSTSSMAYMAVDYIGAKVKQPDKLQIAATITIVLGTATIHYYGLKAMFPQS